MLEEAYRGQFPLGSSRAYHTLRRGTGDDSLVCVDLF